MFTKAFWVIALEAVLTSAVTAFLSSQLFIAGLTWKNFAAAGTAALAAAVATFLKQLGGSQAVKAAAKASAGK